MIKGVIFDLDGTLLHTVPDLHDCMNAMLRHFGYPEITENDTRRFIGHGAREFVLQSLPPEARGMEKECLKFYGEYYEQSGSPKTALFDGVDELLKKLTADGVKLAIVSNKPQRNTEDVYRKYLSAYNFAYVTGHVKGVEVKPDPTLTLDCIQKLGLKKEETVFVGDGETDVQTAIRAGIKGISVLWGYRDKAELIEAGATHFVETASQLYQAIRSL